MSKRKRSWESSTISSQGQTAEIALTGYEGHNFSGSSITNHCVNPSEAIQNLSGEEILPYEASSIDQRLHEASAAGPPIDASWKPDSVTPAVRNDSEAFPSITRKITACDVCRKQKVGTSL
ncbi:uncharacterized protein A1O9_07516 [Exophiala aquamarina CBS 119918]|uniref:Uncharacterized protein n=1 Tax=Exophiala aquamarina CBS 119918 TaxID=1182545 RepID=A0A072P7V0_9EURO|nr:uncharacterized protein A1O9_07516 [Exophiala aquamarina CBS 119918]KEF55936.1 hypothetical protein A1O9_07516 [Exophiala aquamarina CBS 119918]